MSDVKVEIKNYTLRLQRTGLLMSITRLYRLSGSEQWRSLRPGQDVDLAPH